MTRNLAYRLSPIAVFLALLFICLSGRAAIFEHPGGGAGGSGTGGIVSNQVIVATVANLYTNNTPHYIQAIGNIGTTTAGSLLVNVTNSSNVRFGQFSENVGTAGATTNQISFTVPPGGWWKYGSVTTTLSDGSQTLVYYATNGSVSYAASAGTAVTAASATEATNRNAVASVSRGGMTYGFNSLTAARTFAASGETVWVHPNRFTNLFGLGKAGVRYHFDHVEITNYFSGNTNAIYSDADGAVTNPITGTLRFWWNQNPDGVAAAPNSSHAFKFTNSATAGVIEFDTGSGTSYVTEGDYPYLFYVDGPSPQIRFSRIDDENPNGLVGGTANTLGSIFWGKGDMYVAGEVGPFSWYSTYGNQLTSGAVANNLYQRSDLVQAYWYSVATNMLYKNWIDFLEVRRGLHGAVPGTAFAFFGGRNYLRGQKIGLPSGNEAAAQAVYTLPGSAPAAETWASVQKIERGSGQDNAYRTLAGGTVWADTLDYADATLITNTPVNYNAGQTFLFNGRYAGRSPFLQITATATNTILRGISVDVSSGPHPAVIVDGSTNLDFTGSYFKASPNTNVMVFTGAATNSDPFPSMGYGVLFRTNFNAGVTFSSTPGAITNWDYSLTKNFSANPALGILTNHIPGMYRVEVWINISATSGTSTGVRLDIYVNGRPANFRQSNDLEQLLDSDVVTLPGQTRFRMTDYVFLPALAYVEAKVTLDEELAESLYGGRFAITRF